MHPITPVRPSAATTALPARPQLLLPSAARPGRPNDRRHRPEATPAITWIELLGQR